MDAAKPSFSNNRAAPVPSFLPAPEGCCLRQKSKCHCLEQSPIYFQVRLGACGTFMSSLALACGWPNPARHRSPPFSTEQCHWHASLVRGRSSTRNASHTRFCWIMLDSFVKCACVSLCHALSSHELSLHSNCENREAEISILWGTQPHPYQGSIIHDWKRAEGLINMQMVASKHLLGCSERGGCAANTGLSS